MESFARGVDGTRIYLRHRRGPSPVTAVLCDGLACDGFIWKYLWDELADCVSVAHWNYRGHGRSAPPASPERVRVPDHAEDLLAVRRALGDPKVVVIGHSMGCQVALEAFRARPEGVVGLVLICGAPGRITHSFKGSNVLAQLLPRLIERVDAHPEIARALWSRVPADVALKVALLTGEVDARAIHPEDLLPYMKHMTHVDLPMFLRMLHAAGEHSAEDMLAEVDVPALVIAGDRDTFTPPRLAERMADALPRGELLLLAEATHVAPIEQTEIVGARIRAFLRDRVGA